MTSHESRKNNLSKFPPVRCNLPSSIDIINNQYELMIMITVQRFDIHPRFSHPTSKLTQLPRHCLAPGRFSNCMATSFNQPIPQQSESLARDESVRCTTVR